MNEQMKKLSAALIIATVMLLAGIVIGNTIELIYPSIKDEYMNPCLFRPWSDPLMSIYFFVPFLNGFILVWLWKKTNHLIKAKSPMIKGINFGISYWCITLPGMFMSYSSFPVSILMVISWSLASFVQLILAGLILSKMLQN